MVGVSCGKETHESYAYLRMEGKRKSLGPKHSHHRWNQIWCRAKTNKVLELNKLGVSLDIIVKNEREGLGINVVIIRNIF